MKKIVALLLITVLFACQSNHSTVVFINSHPSDYTYKVEDVALNVYYTNDYRQVSATCIVFMAQDSTEHKVCGKYSITLLKY